MKGTGRFIRLIGRHVRREKWISLGSFLVLVIVLVLVDLFWVASINVNRQYGDMAKSVAMELFLSDDLPESALPTLERSLKSLTGVGTVSFVSKTEAAAILEHDLGNGILDELEENPLPRSFVIRFNRTVSLAALDDLRGRLRKLAGVDAVEFNRAWIDRLESTAGRVRQAMFVVGLVILAVVLFTMANTSRLTARSKTQDLFQLRLLGAGPAHLEFPFLAEGFLSGFVAALLGWAIMILAAEHINLWTVPLLFPSPAQVLLYAALAGLTGMLGAYLGIRRFLVS